jgi:hypothetical protein
MAPSELLILASVPVGLKLGEVKFGEADGSMYPAAIDR